MGGGGGGAELSLRHAIANFITFFRFFCKIRIRVSKKSREGESELVQVRIHNSEFYDEMMCSSLGHNRRGLVS